MNPSPNGRVHLRRRAVLAGRAFDAQGRPFVDGERLSLCAADEVAPARSPAKRAASGSGTPKPHGAPASWKRHFRCHMRRDGCFFFLDVPAGRYVLQQVDPSGAIVQSREVSIPKADPSERVPVARVEFEIVGHADPRPAPTERN